MHVLVQNPEPISDHMDQFTCLQTGDLGDHHQQHGVLADVPVVGSQHVLAAKYFDLVRFYYGRKFYVDSISEDRGYKRALMVKEYQKTEE